MPVHPLPPICSKPVKTLTTKERKKSRFGNAFHLCREVRPAAVECFFSCVCCSELHGSVDICSCLCCLASP